MNTTDLSQPEKEALLDLLLAATYGDAHLSLSENAVVRSTYEGIEWESGSSYEIDYAEHVAEIRERGEEENGISEYVAERCMVFATTESRDLVLEHLAEVLGVDGTVPAEKLVYDAAVEALSDLAGDD